MEFLSSFSYAKLVIFCLQFYSSVLLPRIQLTKWIFDFVNGMAMAPSRRYGYCKIWWVSFPSIGQSQAWQWMERFKISSVQVPPNQFNCLHVNHRRKLCTHHPMSSTISIHPSEMTFGNVWLYKNCKCSDFAKPFPKAMTAGHHLCIYVIELTVSKNLSSYASIHFHKFT